MSRLCPTQTNLTKKEIIHGIKDYLRDEAQFSLTSREIKLVLEGIASIVRIELSIGNEIILPGLGKFSTSNRAARKDGNPAAGAEIDISAKYVPKFSAAKTLKDAVANI